MDIINNKKYQNEKNTNYFKKLTAVHENILSDTSIVEVFLFLSLNYKNEIENNIEILK